MNSESLGIEPYWAEVGRQERERLKIVLATQPHVPIEVARARAQAAQKTRIPAVGSKPPTKLD